MLPEVELRDTLQFVLSFRTSVLCSVWNLGEPREAARSLRRNNRAFGSLPCQAAPLAPVSRQKRHCSPSDIIKSFATHIMGKAYRGTGYLTGRHLTFESGRGA